LSSPFGFSVHNFTCISPVHATIPKHFLLDESNNIKILKLARKLRRLEGRSPKKTKRNPKYKIIHANESS
jgi:hypothetical protein